MAGYRDRGPPQPLPVASAATLATTLLEALATGVTGLVSPAIQLKPTQATTLPWPVGSQRPTEVAVVLDGLQAAPAYAHQKSTDVRSGFENDRRSLRSCSHFTIYYISVFSFAESSIKDPSASDSRQV
jgi:hypothetical protein